MKSIVRIINRITDAFGWLAGLAIALTMVQVTLDVLGKYLFSSPLPTTTIAVANYYMVFVTFLPLAFVERTDGHISVEVLTELMPECFKRHLYGWTHLLTAAVSALLGYATWLESMKMFHSDSFQIEFGTKIIIWPAAFTAPLGFWLFALLLVFKFLAYLTGESADHYKSAYERELEGDVTLSGD